LAPNRAAARDRYEKRKGEAVMKIDIDAEISGLAGKLGMAVIGRFREFADPAADFPTNLLRLLREQHDVARRAQIAARARRAGIMTVKTLDSFEISEKFAPKLEAGMLERLADCSYIAEKANVIAFGPPGRGKTHLALALGYEAIKRDRTVKFKVASTMTDEMREASHENRLIRYIKALERCDLLIIDELGYLEYDAERADLLFKILGARHGCASTMITTNLGFGQWGKFIKDKMIATAMVSRICDNAYLLDMNGGVDYRLESAKKAQKARQAGGQL
jgi:DNA replication protein DnaC